MSAFTCCTSVFAALSKAAAKAASAQLRRISVLSTHPNWPSRAALCERCHLRVLYRGVSYCGRPFLQDIDRDPVTDGCGCLTRDKAKSPNEHCPLDSEHRLAKAIEGHCNCKWCSL